MSDDRLAALEAMLAEDPDDAFTRYALALELRARGEGARAIAALEELARRAPDYVPTWFQWARALDEAGRSDEAERVARRGVEVATAAGDDHTRRELEDLLEGL